MKYTSNSSIDMDMQEYFEIHDELSLQMYEDEERFYQELMDEPDAAYMEYLEDCRYL